MLSIDTREAQNYCAAGNNTLAASVTWAFNLGAKTLTVTDTTTYVSPDVREIVNVEVYDYFGGKAVGAIVGVATNVVIDVSGLNLERGLAASVIVVSHLGKRKDGSRFHIAENSASGSFVVEK